MNLKKGDVIDTIEPRFSTIDNTPIDMRRQITEVRKTGYTWIYPDTPDKDFLSENSNDPFFEMGRYKKVN